MNVTQAGSYLNSISGMPPSLTMSPMGGTNSSLFSPAGGDSFSAGNAGSALGGLGGGMDMSGMSGLSGLGGLGGNAGLSGMGGMSGLGGMSSLGGLGGMSSMGGLGGMSSMGGMSGMSGMGGLSGMSGGSGGIMGMIMQIMQMMMSLISMLMGGGLGGQSSGAGSGGSQDPYGSAGASAPGSSGSAGSAGGAPAGSAGGAPAGDAGNAGFSAPGTTQGTSYNPASYNDPTQTYAGGYGPTPTGGGPTPTGGSPAPTASGGAPTASGGATPTASGGATPTGGSYTPSSVQGGQLKLFGGSQSGENNLNFTNKTGKDMYVFAQKNLDPGEKDPGGTVFKVPAGGSLSVSAVDDKGLRFQAFHDKLTPDQQAQLDSKGSVDGITVPGKTETLYETNYVSAKHLSYDDISPLDGAKTPLTMSGNGGRTEEISQQVIDNAPGRQADGYVPGVGPSASSTDNAAKNPALRDYYDKMSQNGNGTRKFYYNSSVGGDADQANVSYTGEQGKVRTTIDLG